MSDDIRLDIAIRADSSQFNRDLQGIYSAIRRLERETVTIGLNVDIGDIAAAEALVRDLATDVDIRLNVAGDSLTSIQGQIDNLNTAVDVRLNIADSEISTAERRISGLGENVQVRVNADGSELDEIEEKLNNIQALATVTVALNVAGAGLTAISGVAGTLADITGVSGLIETNELLIELEATTGRLIPNADRLINDLFVAGWGDSRQQIADTIEEATNLRVPFDELPGAVESALRLVAVNSEYSTQEYLRTQQQLVQNGLASTYEEAADIITAGLQNGLNAQDDLLDTLFEYTPDFADFQLTGEQVVNAIGNGMSNGFRNSDLAADAIREFQTRIINDFNKPEYQDALNQLGQLDEAEAFKAGEITGAELLSGVTNAIGDLLDSGEIDLANQLAATLFGTQAEDIGARGIAALDPFVEYVDTDIPGAAERASDKMSTSFSAITDRIGRIISTGIGEELDAAFDLTGRIQAAEEAATTFFDLIGQGESVGTAAGVALRIAGLDELQNLLADFLIGFLQGIREVVAVLPNSNTSGLDSLIATLGGAQLEVDLVAADNAGDIEEAVRQAVDRGVSDPEIFTSLTDALDNADLAGTAEILNILDDREAAFERFGVVLEEGIDLNSDGLIDAAEAYQTAAASVDANNYDPEIIDEYAEAILRAANARQEFGDQLGDQFDDALNNLDLQQALDLNELFTAEQQAANEPFINQIRGQLEFNVQQALDGFNLQDANAALDLLGDEAPPELAGQVEELATYLRDQFATAISEQDFDTAGFIAEQIGTEELQSTFDNIVENLGIDEETAAQIAQTLGLSDAAGQLSESRETIETDLDTIDQSMTSTADNVGTKTTDISTNFTALGADLSIFGEGWQASTLELGADYALFSDGVLESNALISASLADLLLGFGEVYDAAAALPGVGGSGGGAVTNNSNTVNSGNVINNSTSNVTNINASPIGF